MADFSDVLLTVDYDRTLTAPDASIPERNLTAIRYFMEHGGAFTVNTGRSLPMSRVFRDAVPVNAPLLLYNGSVAYDLEKREPCFFHAIPLPQAALVEDFRRLFPDMTLEVQTLEAHYCFEEDPDWDAYAAHNGYPRRLARPDDDLGPLLKLGVYGQLRGVHVAGFYTGTEEEMRRIDAAEQLLKQLYGEYCEVFRAAPRILNIHAKGVSKIRAARELQRRLQRKYLICVGDGENDINMLEGADYAFCPGDAIVADRFRNVCPCTEGAVADVIYKKIPEILEKKLDNRV